jgi:hypothetical protein
LRLGGAKNHEANRGGLEKGLEETHNGDS